MRGSCQTKSFIHTNRIGEGIKRLPAGFTKVLQTKVFEAVRTLKQVNPEATEVCDNELDDDCDGQIDEGYLRPICNLSDRRRGLRIGFFDDPCPPYPNRSRFSLQVFRRLYLLISNPFVAIRTSENMVGLQEEELA